MNYKVEIIYDLSRFLTTQACSIIISVFIALNISTNSIRFIHIVKIGILKQLLITYKIKQYYCFEKVLRKADIKFKYFSESTIL